MKICKGLFMLVGAAGLALMLNASVTRAQVPVDAANPPDSEFNHLECYKVTEDAGATYNFDLFAHDTNFLPEQTHDKGCRLRMRADSICIDARTKKVIPDAIWDGPRECANGTPCVEDADCLVLGPDAGYCSKAVRTSAYGNIPNAWDYICYRIRCDRQSQPGPGTTVRVKDRFGERPLKVRRSWKICVPILDKEIATP